MKTKPVKSQAERSRKFAVSVWRALDLVLGEDFKSGSSKKFDSAMSALNECRESLYAERDHSGRQFARVTAIEILAAEYKKRGKANESALRKILANSLGIEASDQDVGERRIATAIAILKRTKSEIWEKFPEVDLKDEKARAAFNIASLYLELFPHRALAIPMTGANYRKLTNKKTGNNWIEPLQGSGRPTREQKTRWLLECANYEQAQIDAAIKALKNTYR